MNRSGLGLAGAALAAMLWVGPALADGPIVPPIITTPTPVPGYSAVVRVDDAGFQPEFITVLPGTVVTFVNAGSRAHSVSSDDGYSFDSSNVNPGQNWSQTFSKIGNFPYHSTAEPFQQFPQLIGAVKVADGPRPTPTPNPAGVDVPYVQIDDYAGFIPPLVTVKAGTIVTWENKGGYVHGVISDSVIGLRSNGLSPKLSPFQNASGGGIFSYQFSEPGAYQYHSVGEGYLGGSALNIFKGTVIVRP